MNDYEKTVQDLADAIQATETAYNNAVDSEDETEIDDAVEILRRVKARAEAKV